MDQLIQEQRPSDEVLPGRKRMLRSISEPFVLATPAGVRIRTRLRPTAAEESALAMIGEHLGRLYRSDLAERVSLGLVPAAQRQRTQRKRAITSRSSSRWAGAITRSAEDQYQLAMRALAAEISQLRSTVDALQKRIDVPVGAKINGIRGYQSRSERFRKTRRLAQIKGRLAVAEESLGAGRPRITVGGRRLWKTRNHLDEASLTQDEWAQKWVAARLFLTADGETGKRGGNETIRIGANGGMVLKVPAPLCETLGDHLALEVPVTFAHRRSEWEDRAANNRCIRYDISYDPVKERWYVDASWSYGDTPVPRLETLISTGLVGVDLNADHLAACRLDASGNPVGAPISIPLELAGRSAGSRDGQLRASITALLDFARDTGCQTIAVEDLNFQRARDTGRETMGRGARGKRFRRTVSSIPTGRFRDRLVSMAANRGLCVIAVDPAYTSRWGSQHWQKPLQASGGTVTRHHAASVAIGRRALGYPIRRQEDGPRTRQRTLAGEPSPRPGHARRGPAVVIGRVRPAATSRQGPPGTR